MLRISRAREPRSVHFFSSDAQLFKNRRGMIAVAMVAWGLFTWTASRLFGPGSAYIGFTSDSAIPLLMSQHRGHTPFSLYYWGQDRFGAWPFLLGSAWSALTGWAWTPERLSTVVISCAMAGAMAFTAFSGGAGWVAGLSCATVLLLQASPRRFVLDLGEPYAWQLVLIVTCWLSLRRLLKPEVKPGPVAGLGFVLMTLASWISPISGPLVFLILLVEVLRSAWNGGQGWGQPAWRRVGLALAAWAVAVATEWIAIRGLYHWFTAAHYRWDHKTLIRGDIPHLRQNVVELARILHEGGSWLVAAISVFSVVCLSLALARSRKEQSSPRQTASTEAWFLAAGASVVAWGNLAICALVSHVRKNAYGDRYLCLTHVFVGIAVGLAIYGLAVRVLRFRHADALVTLAFSLSLVVLLYARLPVRADDANYQSLKELARIVSDGGRDRVLLGDYWSVYALAALAPVGALIPLEPDAEEDPRMPFNQSALRPGSEVLVVYQEPAPGSAENPGEELAQYGTRLHLVDRRPWIAAGRSVWTYQIAAANEPRNQKARPGPARP